MSSMRVDVPALSRLYVPATTSVRRSRILEPVA